MNLTRAKEVIEAAGFEAKEVEVVKGGIYKHALNVGSGKVLPTIYEETVADMDDEELISFVARITGNLPDSVDIVSLLTREYVLDHVVSCVRPLVEGDKNAVALPTQYEGIEEVFKIALPEDLFAGKGQSTVQLTWSLAKSIDLTSEEVQEAARENLRAQATVRSMSEVLSGMGADIPEGIVDEVPPMLVASNLSNTNGASVILLTDYLSEVAQQYGWDGVIIVPSSVHEVLLLPDVNVDLDYIAAMIAEVNTSQVAPEDVLSWQPYRLPLTATC